MAGADLGVNGQRKVKMPWKVLNNQMKGNGILFCAFSSRIRYAVEM